MVKVRYSCNSEMRDAGSTMDGRVCSPMLSKRSEQYRVQSMTGRD